MVTIKSSWKELEAYYDRLNTDEDLMETRNDISTPLKCVEQMVDKIPEDFFSRSDTKWLDPCCGCGNFFAVIYQRLKKYHKHSHIIKNMLYFNDVNEKRIKKVKEIFGSKTNITMLDFLQYDESKPYNVIVANPPYAKIDDNKKRASKNHNMIKPFIDKTLSLLIKDGFMLYITPDNWMSLSDRNTVTEELSKKQINYINIHEAKKYFPKVGSSFTWYLVQNKEQCNKTTVEGVWKGVKYSSEVILGSRSYIPLYYNDIVHSILQKTIDADLPRYNVETTSDLHKYTKKNLISTTKDDEHVHRLIHTPSQTVWASRPHKYQEGYKVFIPTTTYYKPFIDNCGMTQSIAFIRVTSVKEAEKIKKMLEHPLYVFLNNICRWGNFNNIRILQKFPVCNESDPYKAFSINNEEQQIIQENT
tara:strand:+ start:116 stop:1366 length:1251 start_codon:yes stop_codon:yes gene_type:complete